MSNLQFKCRTRNLMFVISYYSPTQSSHSSPSSPWQTEHICVIKSLRLTLLYLCAMWVKAAPRQSPSRLESSRVEQQLPYGSNEILLFHFLLASNTSRPQNVIETARMWKAKSANDFEMQFLLLYFHTI